MPDNKRWLFPFKARILQKIRERRDSWIFKFIATVSQKYLRAWYNQDFWSSDLNGEHMVLDVISKNISDEIIIFDVGANIGNWAEAIKNRMPKAEVFCFEIVPETFAELRRRLLDREGFRFFDFGFSDKNSTVEVAINIKNSTVSSISPRNESLFFAQDASKKKLCKVVKGDEFMLKNKIPKIDFLKIDVEGHELFVLRGLKKTIMNPISRPRIIQFEYGDTYIPSGATLFEVAHLLESNDYCIGRIFPRYVEFKQVELEDEHFRMGNYLALQKDDTLIAELSP